MTAFILSLRCFALSLVALLPVAAFAQQAPQQTQQPPITAPDTSTARFGDWVLRCTTVQSGKICELVQSLQLQNQAGQQVPFAMLAIGRLARGEPLKFIAQLPSNITVAGGITVETKPDRPITGSFTRCLPVGCFGEVVISDDIRRRWAVRSEPGTVRFNDGANQPITLPISFRGFAAAVEAMQKEVP